MSIYMVWGISAFLIGSSMLYLANEHYKREKSITVERLIKELNKAKILSK